ncbi:MAG: glk1 [Panacagrimonas sp.]|nr:glucokinase [Panacagrimonas sp.]MCC2654898.1 glk1 [Panacagrimonas sp.]
MNSAADARVLVADVGGTNCRFALGRRDRESIELEHVQVVPTPSEGFDVAARRYLADAGGANPAAIGVAAAGRVRRDGDRSWIALTNTPLVLDRQSLGRLCGGRALLANDLAAVAAALPHLRPGDASAFGPDLPSVAGHRVVLGVGTGLGAALLTERGETVDTEAGHADLPCVRQDEHRWCGELGRTGRVSIEHVLCGSGLLRLHAVVASESLDSVDALLDRWRQGDAAARATLSAFATWLGRVAGNLVLSAGAWGGVSLIGGVISGLGPALDPAAFRRGFEDKAPFARDLAAVPVHRILHPQPALLGMAALALRA